MEVMKLMAEKSIFKSPVEPAKSEAWLNGPVGNIPALLQPAAHALIQARDEVSIFMKHFSDHLLWNKPAGMASPAFHLQHLAGVLDRLFTYAREEQLNREQLAYLSAEGIKNEKATTASLLQAFDGQVDQALNQLQYTNEEELTSVRYVGRQRIPSTLIGLLFHAAEHTQRHVGQLLVTSRILMANESAL